MERVHLTRMVRKRTKRGRRRILLSVASISTVGLAGCLGSSENESDPPDSGENDHDLDPEQVTLVESWLDALDAERKVNGWRVFSDQILPEYGTEGSPKDDIPVLGTTYADAVANGLDRVTMPIAMGDNGVLEFMVYIYPEWAEEYTNGEIDEDEYFELIEEAIH